MTRGVIVWAAVVIAALAATGWFITREENGEGLLHPSVGDATSVRSPFQPSTGGAPFPQQSAERSSQARQSSDTEGRAQAPDSSSDFSRRHALYATASQAGREQLDALITQAKAIANGVERRSTLEILLLRYAELDPDGALRQAMSMDRPTGMQLLATLAHVAPDQAWERAAEVADAAARRAYQRAVVGAWVTQEPERAFARVATLPADWQRAELLEHVTSELARLDPRLAIELLGTVEPASASSLLDLVAEEWSRDDPTQAAQWIGAIAERSTQARLAYKIAGAYIAQKPAEALSWALSISNSPGRNLWSYMLGEMALHQPQEALRLAQAAENPAQRTRATAAVLGTIARRDPMVAMSYLQKLPSAGGMRSSVLAQLAAGLVETTPVAAVEWIERIEDRTSRIEVTQQLATVLAGRDVDLAAQLLDRVPKEARPIWLASVANAYADVDIEKGRQWVMKYQHESPELAARFARTVAARSPELALQLAGDVADDRERDRLLAGMLPMIAMQSPQSAARWAVKVSDDASRQQVVGNVANIWATYDAPAARTWVLSLEDGPVRDQALTNVLLNTASLDDALTLVGQIQSQEQRMNAVMRAAMNIAQDDPEGARTLVRRYPLDPERQQNLDNYFKHQLRGQ